MSPLPVALALFTLFAADPVKVYKKELSRVSSRQKMYEAKEIDEELRKAYDTYRAPWRESGKPDAPNSAGAGTTRASLVRALPEKSTNANPIHSTCEPSGPGSLHVDGGTHCE